MEGNLKKGSHFNSLSLSLFIHFFCVCVLSNSQRQVAERTDHHSCRKGKPIPTAGYYYDDANPLNGWRREFWNSDFGRKKERNNKMLCVFFVVVFCFDESLVGSERSGLDSRMDCPSGGRAHRVGASAGGREGSSSGGGRGGRVLIGRGAKVVAAEDRCPSRENAGSAGWERATGEEHPAGSGSPSSGHSNTLTESAIFNAIISYQLPLTTR